MSINWKWDEKCGEAIVRDVTTGKEFVKTLYEGNCFLIFLNEWEENDKKLYSLYTFFADETHAKRCLGLVKDYDNVFEADNWYKLIKIKFNKKKSRNWKKLIVLFARAFDNIDIEIYSEDEQ